MDSTTGAIKDKFLAGGGALVLLACYMALKLAGADTTFIEGAFLVMLGVFGGLLKQSPQSHGQTVTGDVVERKEIN
jgi:hypothetical protein